ncbi:MULTISPECIES: 2-amino-4-hydroxy-6-hydroxymethyldihydropteridine diphosphokinase [Rheinheimera]|uniref:2-amino-4-hydroxy-6-hydroxymethyldihydropteridine diphosphokinase n=1 Tax=Rheinheimera marina TaxID=1774958 RepID=A0ABV9JS71_9GAMM
MALIYISVGSNIDRERHVSAAYLELHLLFGTLRCSRVFESEAVGFSGDAFYNLVIEAHTEMSVADCVSALKNLEQRYGKAAASPKFCGKTLDLDLLTYDDLVCQQPVELPRGEILKNAFVLWPLAELAPDQRHPVTQQSYQALWQAYQEPQKLEPIEFVWPDPTVVLPASLLPADAQPVCV